MPDGVAGASAAFQDDDTWSCPRDLTAPSRIAHVWVLEGARPRDLAGAQGWFVAERQVELGTSRLGCAPWGLLCDIPPDVPVVPAVPRDR